MFLRLFLLLPSVPDGPFDFALGSRVFKFLIDFFLDFIVRRPPIWSYRVREIVALRIEMPETAEAPWFSPWVLAVGFGCIWLLFTLEGGKCTFGVRALSS
jgi:hypothetical protein